MISLVLAISSQSFGCFMEIVYLCTRRIEDRAPAFMNLGLRRSFIKRRSNARGALHVVTRRIEDRAPAFRADTHFLLRTLQLKIKKENL